MKLCSHEAVLTDFWHLTSMQIHTVNADWDDIGGLIAKFHEPPILIIFGLELQIMIYLINLASTARHANLIDTTGGHGRRPRPLLCPLH